MSEYQFKNLNKVEKISEPTDMTNVMGFKDGVPIQMPASSIRNACGVFLINQDDPDYSTTDTAYGDKVKESLLGGKPVLIYWPDDNSFRAIYAFRLYSDRGRPTLDLYFRKSNNTDGIFTFSITSLT